jgi:L-aminopeptidase/D-esterase-like protein
MNGTLSDIEGLKIGHAQDSDKGLTGCTVILCPPETVGGVDQRGGAPGTRETDLLQPMHLVQHLHAVFLSGGSAYGLSVGDGVMRYLEELEIGYPTAAGPVPIVSGAILYDLDMGERKIRPDAAMGYRACQIADGGPVAQGSVGAGTGAKIGGLLGLESATKGGLGSASMEISPGLRVAALFAVNSVGDVLDEAGQILAGVRGPDGQFIGCLNLLRTLASPPAMPANTVIGVVATNARLNKEETNKVAQMAHDGIARAVNPAHTPFDGDTIFALSTGTYTGKASINVGLIGAFAAEMAAAAIRKGVRQASSLGGVRAIS